MGIMTAYHGYNNGNNNLMYNAHKMHIIHRKIQHIFSIAAHVRSKLTQAPHSSSPCCHTTHFSYGHKNSEWSKYYTYSHDFWWRPADFGTPNSCHTKFLLRVLIVGWNISDMIWETHTKAKNVSVKYLKVTFIDTL